VSVFNRFISVYHTKGNMRLLAESFQRQLIIQNIREWFSRNVCFFIQRQQAPSGIQEPLVSEEVIGVEAPISETTVVQEEQNTSNCCGSIEVKSEVVAPEEVVPEVVQEEVVQEEVVQEEVVQEEVVAPEVVQEEVVAPEEEAPEEVAPEEATVIEEPVKAKRGRKKKIA